MSDKYASSSLQAIELFRNLVKAPLQVLLGGEVFSVEAEAQASSPVAQVLDKSASTDLAVRYQTTSAVFLAASRLLYSDDADCRRYPLSLTLRNSVNGSYESTELNKLKRAVDLLSCGVPVVVPRYLCFARLSQKDNPTQLFDVLAAETIPLIRHVFAPDQLGLPELRRRMESDKKKEVLLDDELKSLAGLRYSGDNTFLFLNRRYLDMHGLPYLYQQM